MCGIYGILAFRESAAPSKDLADRMGSVIVHRGPDEGGSYHRDGILLGMRRLSIIDLEGGHQPIANEDESIWVVCNGEIYNFRELREQLLGLGHVFKTQSDSEVIVHLYEEYGDEFVAKLDGMFGFALWDAPRRRLLVGRDRLGIKPIYYALDSNRLLFGSELKSILALPDVNAELDMLGVEQYFGLGYVPTPYSMLKNIQKLPTASLMVVENGTVEITRYWQPDFTQTDELSEADWIELTRAAVSDAVASQMVSDVPIGAFLSGGIDSSAVVAFMARNSDQPINTYSIGFDTGKAGKFYNELPYAKQVADLFGTNHREIIVKPNVTELLPKLLWHMDEPIADSAFITTYLVSQFASQDVKVILSGVGGDELFGGYKRYLGSYYGQRYNRLPGWLRHKVIKPLARGLPSDRHSRWLNVLRQAKSFVLANDMPFDERYAAYVQVFSSEQRQALLREYPSMPVDLLAQSLQGNENWDDLSRIIHADFSTQLPDDLLMLTDKMSMATSLECRVPLLDTRLVELAGRMPSNLKIRGRDTKYILKKALADVLPREILYRPKRGFGAPMGGWLKNELSGFLRQVLSRESIEQRGLFNWNVINHTIQLHEASKEDHTDHLLALVNFELWCRIYLDGHSSQSVTETLQAA